MTSVPMLRIGSFLRFLAVAYAATLYQSAWAQTKSIDSLQSLTRSLTGKDSIIAQRQLAMALADYYIDRSSYQEARLSLERAKQQLGADTIDSGALVAIQKQLGVVHAHLGNLSTAIDYFSKCRSYYEHHADPAELSTLMIDIGFVFAELGNFEVSLKSYFDALSIVDAYRLDRERALLEFRIAWVYYELNQDDHSERYARQSLEHARSGMLAFEEASALNLLGLLSYRAQKYDQALQYYDQALAIRRSNDFKAGVGSTLLNIGDVYEKLKRFDEALDIDLKSLAVEESIQHAVGIAYSCQSLGALLTRMGNYRRAHEYLARGEDLSRRIKAESILRDIYRNQRDLAAAEHKYEAAVRYSLLYESLNDSIFNRNLANRITTLQNAFELDQKAKQIQILNQQTELQNEKLTVQEALISRQRMVIFFAISAFLAICAIAYVIYRYYHQVKSLHAEVVNRNEEIQTQSEELTEANEALSKLNQEISEQKEEIEAQAEALAKSNLEISKANEGLEEKVLTRTKELQQAYRELDTFFYRSSHDFRRPLTTFMGLAEVAKITVEDESALELFAKVEQTALNLDRMLLKLQSISDAGSLEMIYKEVPLKEIIDLELAHLEKEIVEHGIAVSVDIRPHTSFMSYPALVKTIIQNLLENAITFHSPQNPFIRISAAESGNMLVITVEDNGEGIEEPYRDRVFEMYFRANTRSKGNGLGLYIVKKMVTKLNGSIELESQFTRGTRIRVKLPNEHP